MNVIDQIQKLLDNFENIFVNEYPEEKFEELKAKYHEIADEYPEKFDISFNETNKEEIKKNLEETLKELDEKDDDVGETSYYLDDSFKNIKYEKENTRVINIKRDFLDGTIIMPDFQRKYVWSKKQVVELIVSFLLNIPIPTLYAYSDFDTEELREKIYVIDGQQRLTSLLFYYYGVFPKSLKNRKKYDFTFFQRCEERTKIKELIKKAETSDEKITLKDKLNRLEEDLKKLYDVQLDVKFQTRVEENGNFTLKDLSLETLEKNDPKLRNLILTTTLEITMLKDFSNMESLARIFNIYNSKGKPLTEDEIRKSLYNKNSLYKKIGEYCLRVENEKLYSNYSKFNSTDIIVSEKRLFQLLSYYFNLTMKFDKNKRKYIKDTDKIQKHLQGYASEKELIQGPLDQDLSTKSTKGKKIDNIISEYSKYIADSSEDVAKEEYESIEKFFNLEFIRKDASNKNKYSFKNLISAYIIARYFNLLDNKNITIGKDILFCKVNYSSTLEYGRVKGIYGIFKKKGYIE
ncbi:MAG: DUF262 domain-containing protein [Fusobacteriaceae bacterium]